MDDSPRGKKGSRRHAFEVKRVFEKLNFQTNQVDSSQIN
jgi:hypothetical protein